jgi:hypothetical protein
MGFTLPSCTHSKSAQRLSKDGTIEVGVSGTWGKSGEKEQNGKTSQLEQFLLSLAGSWGRFYLPCFSAL